MPFEAKVNPQSLLDNLRDLYGPKITAADIKAYCAQHDVTYQTVTKYLLPYKKGIGKWNLTVTQQLEKNYELPAAQPAIEQNLIPEKDDSFVKFGNFGDLKKIIQSRLFYPAFITGLSGNGKTLSVEQALCSVGSGTDSCQHHHRNGRRRSYWRFPSYQWRYCLAQWSCHRSFWRGGLYFF